MILSCCWQDSTPKCSSSYFSGSKFGTLAVNICCQLIICFLFSRQSILHAPLFSWSPVHAKHTCCSCAILDRLPVWTLSASLWKEQVITHGLTLLPSVFLLLLLQQTCWQIGALRTHLLALQTAVIMQGKLSVTVSWIKSREHYRQSSILNKPSSDTSGLALLVPRLKWQWCSKSHRPTRPSTFMS